MSPIQIWPDDISSGEVTLGDLAALAAFSYIGNETAASATPTAVKMTKIPGLTSVVTAAGTTVLTNVSKGVYVFTGVTTQTITLPDVTTLPVVSFGYFIINQSTGALTVNSSGSNLVQTIGAGASAILTCVLLTGTTAASWSTVPVVAVNTAGTVNIPLGESYNIAGVKAVSHNNGGGYISFNEGAVAGQARIYGGTIYMGGGFKTSFDGTTGVMSVTEQSSQPATPAASTVGVYVDNTGTPNLKILDDSGFSRVVTSNIFTIVPAGDFNLATTLGVQAAFPTTGDVISLDASTGYFFEGAYYITHTTTTCTAAMAFACSSAPTSCAYNAISVIQAAADGAPAAASMTWVDTVATTVVAATSTAGWAIVFRGILRTNGATTVTPQINWSANTTAPVMKVNSYVRFVPYGTNVTNIGGNVA